MDELYRAIKLDINLSLVSNLNNLNNVKETRFYKKCNCKEQLEMIYNNLNEKTISNFVNMILERNRRVRRVAMDDNLTNSYYKCSYSHRWFEANIRSYLFSNPEKYPKISRKI